MKKYYLKNPKKIVNDFTIKSKKNIDYISGLNLIFDDTKFLNQNVKNKIIKDIFFTALENYKFIFVDTSSYDELNLNSILLENCMKILLVTEANLLGIKEVREEINNLKIKDNLIKDKLKIIINNYDKESFNMKVLKKCLKDFSIVGKVKSKKIGIFKNNFNYLKLKKIIR